MRTRNWKDKSGYTYGLHGTPTTFVLEERIAALEGGRHCVLLPSGLAAIANVNMALLEAGDEVLIPDNAYGPNKALAEGELARWGITHQLYDALDPADLQARITPADPAGLAGGPRLGNDGISAAGASGPDLPPAGHHHGAGQHLGRRAGIQWV
jgi:7-keto-8-aminopelargonate synthetase-like enzyme